MCCYVFASNCVWCCSFPPPLFPENEPPSPNECTPFQNSNYRQSLHRTAVLSIALSHRSGIWDPKRLGYNLLIPYTAYRRPIRLISENHPHGIASSYVLYTLRAMHRGWEGVGRRHMQDHFVITSQQLRAPISFRDASTTRSQINLCEQ